MLGKTIGKYQLVEELARDGTSTIYKAIDETLDREVAVKMLNPRLAGSEGLKRFQAEASTLARLQHTDIVRIHEVYRNESDLLLVMELVRGETLTQKVARGGPLAPEQAAHLVVQVLGALAHAHDAGVLHGDLKPSNVAVIEGDHVKLTDFGLSRAVGEDDLTSDGFPLDSPAYMAPERLGGKVLDGRADLYSAGVIFYFLLTGHVPFEAATLLEVMQRQLEGSAIPAVRFRPGLPGWCQAVLDRALARSPADRFQTAEAFRTTLLGVTTASTEETGAFAVPAGVASGDAPTATMSASMVETLPAPSPNADAVTVAVSSGVAPTAVEPSPAAPTAWQEIPVAASAIPGGKTVILKKRDMATIGGLLAALAIGVVILAVIALRQHELAPEPATTTVGDTPSAAEATTEPVAAPPVEAPATTPAPVATVRPRAAPPAGVSPAVPPVGISPVSPAAPPAGASPGVAAPAAVPSKPLVAESRPPAEAKVAEGAPYTFLAKAVVVDGSKYRERDAVVQLAGGSVTVKDRDEPTKAIYLFPIASVTNLLYSNSRQPLMDSPKGPIEAMRVETGFFRGNGAKNWVSLRTNASLLVLRVEDDDAVKVTAALESRTGLTLERLAEGKDE